MIAMRYRKYDITTAAGSALSFGQSLSCRELDLHGFGSEAEIVKAIDKKTFDADLAEALKDAEASAIASDPGEGLENDGGSCNFDQAYIVRRRLSPAKALKIANLAGVSLEKGYRAGMWLVGTTLHGQAARRTVMARAAATRLNEAGFDAAVHYAVD